MANESVTHVPGLFCYPSTRLGPWTLDLGPRKTANRERKTANRERKRKTPNRKKTKKGLCDDRASRVLTRSTRSAFVREGRRTRKESDDELQNAGGLSARETIAAAPSKNYLIQIRALTEIGDAQLSADEIVKSYRKEVESVLQKEDIPPNYRKYIKNYFHSIGIKTEKEAYESR